MTRYVIMRNVVAENYTHMNNIYMRYNKTNINVILNEYYNIFYYLMSV